MIYFKKTLMKYNLSNINLEINILMIKKIYNKIIIIEYNKNIILLTLKYL